MSALQARGLLAASALSLVLSLTSSAQARVTQVRPVRVSVWTVDAAGGAHFQDLPAAVRAARSGDVLLVAPGEYAAFELHGKGLSILGDGGVPRIHGTVLARGLAADQVLDLRSLELRFSAAGSLEASAALRLEDNAGTVWIEDCTIQRELFPLALTDPDDAALVATNCAALVLVRSRVVCNLAGFVPATSPAGSGLFAAQSSVHAYESELTGGSILPTSGSQSFVGGSGASLVDSFLHAAGSAFVGGQGDAAGFQLFFGCIAAGQGGAGVHAAAAGTAPITLGCTFQGGPGGAPRPPFCEAGPSGPPAVGSVVEVPVPVRSYELATPVRSGTSYLLEAHGEPGDLVWSMLAESLDPAYVPSVFGTHVGAPPTTLVFEGVLDASGSLSKSVPIPPLAGLTSFERLWAQGLFFDGLRHPFLGSPSLLVVVN